MAQTAQTVQTGTGRVRARWEGPGRGAECLHAARRIAPAAIGAGPQKTGTELQMQGRRAASRSTAWFLSVELRAALTAVGTKPSLRKNAKVRVHRIQGMHGAGDSRKTRCKGTGFCRSRPVRIGPAARTLR
jgi:hypothetical protein